LANSLKDDVSIIGFIHLIVFELKTKGYLNGLF